MKVNIYALGFGMKYRVFGYTSHKSRGTFSKFKSKSLSVESSKVVGGNNVFYFSGGLRYARLFAGRPRNE